MKTLTAILAALVFGSAPAIAQTVPSRVAVLTFNQTNASSSPACQGMITSANDIEARPYVASRLAGVLATEASSCLRDVEFETNDSLAAQVPLTLLAAACHRLKADNSTDYRNLKGYCVVR